VPAGPVAVSPHDAASAASRLVTFSRREKVPAVRERERADEGGPKVLCAARRG